MDRHAAPLALGLAIVAALTAYAAWPAATATAVATPVGDPVPVDAPAATTAPTPPPTAAAAPPPGSPGCCGDGRPGAHPPRHDDQRQPAPAAHPSPEAVAAWTAAGIPAQFTAAPPAAVEARLGWLDGQAATPDAALGAGLLDLLGDARQGDTVRNEIGKTLVAWNQPGTVAALIDQVADRTQSLVWRRYCVQLLELHVARHDDAPALAALDALAGGDGAVADQALFCLATLAVDRGWRSVDPARFAALCARAGARLGAPQPACVENALAVCARLGLAVEAPAIERLAAAADGDPGVRVAAVNALGALGLARSAGALRACVDGDAAGGTLGQMAALALRRLDPAASGAAPATP